MLDSLHIKNFRCFEDLTIPSLGRVNLIVGKNSVGKSTLLEAIAVFSSGGHRRVINSFRNLRDDFSENESTYLFNRKSQIQDLEIGNIKNKLKIMTRAEVKKQFPNLFNNMIQSEIGYRQRISHEDNDENEFSEDSRLENISVKEDFPKLINRDYKEDPHYYSGTHLEGMNELEKMWGVLFKNGEKEVAIDIIKIINDQIEDIDFVREEVYEGFRYREERKIIRVPMVKIRLLPKDIPLGSKPSYEVVPIRSLGEGTLRILQIVLAAFQARSGFLLIDEFENGLHYSIQEEVWEKIFQITKKLDIQVFATTHSEDTVKAFSKVALQSEDENEARIISLGKSVGKSEYGKIFATVFDRDGLELITETGIEVR